MEKSIGFDDCLRAAFDMQDVEFPESRRDP